MEKSDERASRFMYVLLHVEDDIEKLTESPFYCGLCGS